MLTAIASQFVRSGRARILAALARSGRARIVAALARSGRARIVAALAAGMLCVSGALGPGLTVASAAAHGQASVSDVPVSEAPLLEAPVSGVPMSEALVSADALGSGLAASEAPSVPAAPTSEDATGTATTVVAQGGEGSDPLATPERRVVLRTSSEKVDAVVIALYSIAGGMTVMLGVFVWHTSPRRRLRISLQRSDSRDPPAAAHPQHAHTTSRETAAGGRPDGSGSEQPVAGDPVGAGRVAGSGLPMSERPDQPAESRRARAQWRSPSRRRLDWTSWLRGSTPTP